MRVLLLKFREVTIKYPIVRGMASYAVIWPTASLLQQKFFGKKEELNYMQALRFSLYGAFFVAPTLFCWIKVGSHILPKNDLKSGIIKVYIYIIFNTILTCKLKNFFCKNVNSKSLQQALVEQVTYGPIAMCCFFFGMNLMEFKPVDECIDEVKQKFWPTYKVNI